jgi:hypothetical protein
MEEDVRDCVIVVIDSVYVGDTVLYVLEITIGSNNQEKKVIQKRFSQIHQLHSELQPKFVEGIEAPPKHYFQWNKLDPEFIETRKLELQVFFNQLTRRNEIVQDPAFMRFFNLEREIIIQPNRIRSASAGPLLTCKYPKPSVVQCPLCNIDLSRLSINLRNSHISSCLEPPIPSSSPPPYIYKGPRPLMDNNPFGVICPYPDCSGAQYEARFFLLHLELNHNLDNTTFPCPICALLGNNVKSKVNLSKHISTAHKDICSNYVDEESRSSVEEIQVDNPHGDYIATIVKKNEDIECIICFCEYEKGQVAARLPCLCYFHKNCIEQWYTASCKRQCPVHFIDE